MLVAQRTVPTPVGNPTSAHNCTGRAGSTQRKGYTTVGERQDSFKCHPNIINLKYSPSDLAEEGFYFDGSQIVCAKCKVTLPSFSSWKKGEKLRDVHKRLQPAGTRSICPFISGDFGQSSISSRGGNGNDDDGDDDEEEEDDDDEVDFGNSTNTNGRNYLQSDDMPAGAGQHLASDEPSPRVSNNSLSVKQKLREENERLRNNCHKCKTEKIQTLFLPCRHLITCEKCAEETDNCLLCNSTILGTVRTYFG